MAGVLQRIFGDIAGKQISREQIADRRTAFAAFKKENATKADVINRMTNWQRKQAARMSGNSLHSLTIEQLEECASRPHYKAQQMGI